MKTLTGLAFSILIGLTLALSGTDDAFAKRLGGGKSFGSRPSYSEPYRPAPYSSPQRSPGMAQPGAPLQQPAFSAAQQRNQAMRDSFRQRGGLTGMLGGLALGGLLGAMLFGGAFEHINFLDILLFAGVAFLLYKLLAARRRSEGAAAADGYYPAGPGSRREGEFDPVHERRAEAEQAGQSGFDTDVLFGKGRRTTSSGQAPFADRSAPAVPADFDTAAFLSGAKAAYEMMQQAWDAGDLAELRALTTDKVFGELQDQVRARGSAPNRTELLKVDAEVLEVRDAGPDREAAVLFDVLLREAPGDSPTQVREVWHFIRPRNSRQPTWLLDGIQQIED